MCLTKKSIYIENFYCDTIAVFKSIKNNISTFCRRKHMTVYYKEIFKFLSNKNIWHSLLQGKIQIARHFYDILCLFQVLWSCFWNTSHTRRGRETCKKNIEIGWVKRLFAHVNELFHSVWGFYQTFSKLGCCQLHHLPREMRGNSQSSLLNMIAQSR